MQINVGGYELSTQIGEGAFSKSVALHPSQSTFIDFLADALKPIYSESISVPATTLPKMLYIVQ